MESKSEASILEIADYVLLNEESKPENENAKIKAVDSIWFRWIYMGFTTFVGISASEYWFFKYWSIVPGLIIMFVWGLCMYDFSEPLPIPIKAANFIYGLTLAANFLYTKFVLFPRCLPILQEYLQSGDESVRSSTRAKILGTIVILLPWPILHITYFSGSYPLYPSFYDAHVSDFLEQAWRILYGLSPLWVWMPCGPVVMWCLLCAYLKSLCDSVLKKGEKCDDAFRTYVKMSEAIMRHMDFFLFLQVIFGSATGILFAVTLMTTPNEIEFSLPTVYFMYWVFYSFVQLMSCMVMGAVVTESERQLLVPCGELCNFKENLSESEKIALNKLHELVYDRMVSKTYGVSILGFIASSSPLLRFCYYAGLLTYTLIVYFNSH